MKNEKKDTKGEKKLFDKKPAKKNFKSNNKSDNSKEKENKSKTDNSMYAIIDSVFGRVWIV